MRKILFTILVVFAQTLMAQKYDLGFDAKVIKNYGVLKSGTTVRLNSMSHTQTIRTLDAKIIREDNYTLSTSAGDVKVKDKLEKVLDVSYRNAQDFWDAQILFNVLEFLSKRGTQEDLRSEMEDDALDYVNWVKTKGLQFDDSFLESYVYSIITKLSPSVLIDGRPGTVNLLIRNDQEANAYMFPNGTLIITTGLLSLLHTEDELAAILAHEIAHFVLDHSVQNRHKIEKAQKRAEFWASLTTGIAATADAYTAAKNPYYKPGAVTYSVAVTANQIASAYCNRLGMDYTREQEDEADEIACKLMKVVGYDSNALATALSRIEETMKQERSVKMYFASDHPALVERIEKAGKPSTNVDQHFERIISYAISEAAYMKMQDRRFRQALPLFSQNIKNGVAIIDDYIQKANCLLYLRNDAQLYGEVTTLLNEAKKINPNNINIYKTELIAAFRHKDYAQCKELLKAYIDRVKSFMKKDENYPERNWTQLYNYARDEIIWANDMSAKLRAF